MSCHFVKLYIFLCFVLSQEEDPGKGCYVAGGAHPTAYMRH